MVRLLLEDVTLLRANEIVAPGPLRGGAVRTLRLPLPLTAPDLRRTDPAVVAELDRLLEEYTDAEAAPAPQCGRPHARRRRALSTPASVAICGASTGSADRVQPPARLTVLLTLQRSAEFLGAYPKTVNAWARSGSIPVRAWSPTTASVSFRARSCTAPAAGAAAPFRAADPPERQEVVQHVVLSEGISEPPADHRLA